MPVNYPHPLLAREGWPILIGGGVAALVVTLWAGWAWASPLWLFFVFCVQFFRDPPRQIPVGEGLVVSPADGRVIVVEEVDDPWLKRRALKISVFMNVFNVHANRSPLDATVKQRWYTPGRFLNAAVAKASTENERNALWLQTPDGKDITCVQIAGLIARRILCHVDAGAVLERGGRYGFIRFGSRVDLYLPVGTEPRVTLGEKVSSGSTVLAHLV
jgi:phosphatidylserine decarboxylase